MVEAERSPELNPLPFMPLRKLLQLRKSVLGCARLAESWGRRAYVFCPLAHYANSLIAKEFERGYDTTVGYLLAHEEVLAAHDHGHAFSLDVQLDAAFKAAVKVSLQSISD